MGNLFDRAVWGAVPFHFWSVTFFVLGSVVGSFLNVCIHRLPRGMSLLSPPSHCPHCGQPIAWYLNVPLVSWLWLRGRALCCRAPITARYFAVELLTALLFLGSWLVAGRQSVGLALVYCLFLAGLLAATFIDLEHFIIPDQISLGGIGAGLVCSALVPALQAQSSLAGGLKASVVGAAVGGGLLYLILRGGKLLFGRQVHSLPPGSRILFTETALVLPDQQIPYEELFYRKSDAITFQARQLELADRGYPVASVRLTPHELQINDDRFDPQEVPHMEGLVDQITLPREAMGLGDVKLMAAIGAFLGWKATLFTLLLSSMVGAAVGLTLIVSGRRQWSSRLPYGPYLAVGAAAWIFGGGNLVNLWLQQPLWPSLMR